VLRPTRVRVPGSTSNLGAGFDCLGLALTRHLTAVFTPVPDAAGLRVERHGTLRALDDRPDTHDVFVRAFRRTLEAHKSAAPRGVLVVDSDIPIGRGLGSSAAAVVGAITLALSALDIAVQPGRVFPIAREYESHLDNVAPALLGGLVGVAYDDDTVARAFALPLSDRIGFAFAAPGFELETSRARAALPGRVPFADAVHNLGALAALIRGLATADAELLRLGFADRLHVPHRLPLITGADRAIANAVAAGAWGATVSGAGSGILAVSEPARTRAVADAMAGAFRETSGQGVIEFAAEPDREGAVVG